MFASSPAGRRSSGSSSGGSANASANANASAAPTAEPAMTQAELLAHQLDLHQKIQQQMQLQMEMSLQLGARQNMAASMASRPSLTASLSRVEPDLGDNVFDMLDDLIMIPGGSVASDTRASLSKHMEADDDDDANGGGAGGAGTQGVGSGSISGSRDSLADILESLDMDLEDFGDENKLIDTSHLMNANYNDEERDSFDDDLDDLDLDLDLEIDDHGIDDDDDAGNNLDDSIDAVDPNEHAVEEDFVHMRRSSLDMLASVSGSVSVSQSTTGNMCTLIWEGGLLGLRLRMSQSRMMPAVSKITGKSSIVGIHLVEVGDLLLQIGDRITRDMEFIDAINYLKEAPKPCKLVFRRLTSDPMIVKPIQPQVSSSIALKLASKFEELTQADNEKNPAPPAVKLDEKYEIKWLDGPLGISLIASKDVPYPLVTRITGKNRSPQVQDVQPGHYLVQIGNYNTADGNFNTAIKFLQKVTKPVSLYFCPGNKKVSARPDAADDEYDHIWEKKQALSFTVKPDVHGRMVVADVGSAKSIKVKAKGVPNIAAFISSGDQIRWINDDPTEGLTFHEALLKLRTAKRPLVIRFKKGPLGAPVDAPTPVPALSPKSVPLTASDMSMSQASPAKKPLSSTNVPPPPPPPPQTQPPPQQQKPVPPPAPRSFNPLKKIAALGAYAKENSMNSGNGKNISNDGKKPSPDGAQTKKHTLFGSNGESDNHTRKYHEAAAAAAAAAAAQANANNGRAPKLAPPSGNNTRSPTSSGNEYQHHQKASSNDGRHNNNGEPHSRIMNLDTLSSQQHRKVGLQKSPSDPAVQSSNSSDPAANLRPLSRGSAKNIPAASPPSDENSRYPSPSSSASTASSSRSYDKDSDVYEVVWPEGTALGLTLRVHPTTRFPVVARVTGTSNLKNIEHVQPGDILFAANNMNIVPQPKFKQTLENLSRLPKPAVLRFRRAQSSGAGNGTSSNTPRAEDTDHALPRGPPLKPSEYELIWRENANLGLVFSSDNDVPKVTKVDLESGGPMLQKVGVGDTLSWIGPMDIHGSSFHQSMATLRAIKRPVVLRFHKRQHR